MNRKYYSNQSATQLPNKANQLQQNPSIIDSGFERPVVQPNNPPEIEVIDFDSERTDVKPHTWGGF